MQSQQNINNNTSVEESIQKVHIKVLNGNEMRRFSITAGSYDYASLVQHINRLFNFSVDSQIELKYNDDEGDMIIISSDEELKFAIELFSETRTLFKIIISITSKDNALVHRGEGWKCGGRKEWKKRGSWKEGHGHGHGHGYGHGYGHGHGHGYGHGHAHPQHENWKQWKVDHMTFKIEKLTKKREELSKKLKDFGAPAPLLEAKITWLDSKIQKLKNIASAVPQENVKHHHFDSESSGEGPKWKRGGRGCGQWKAEHLNFKIEKLTQKRNFLAEKYKESGAPHLEQKIACLDAWITKMKQFATAIPHQFHGQFHQQPHPFVPPFVQMCDKSESSESSSESSEGKCGRRRHGCGRKGRFDGNERQWWASDPICMQMWKLRKEKKQLKRLVQVGPESLKTANIDRINTIHTELTELREKKLAQHK